jgi:DNA polymerase-1
VDSGAAPTEGAHGDQAAGAPRTLMLVDASGYIFRAFHALPPMTTSKGIPTNAVLGFCRMMLKLLRDRRPTHVALCFDRDSRLGRLAIDPAYKANRPETPPELVPQFALIRRVAEVLALPILEEPGWEADDVIATMTRSARADGYEVEIVSSDKDLLQLLGDGVRLYDPSKNCEVGQAEAMARFGVPPAQMRDFQALVGDSSDNVPNVPGVGPKTAAELLRQFGDVETLLARVDEVSKPKLRQLIRTHDEQIRRALRLVTFRTDLPVAQRASELARREPHQGAARELFTELEFSRLLSELPRPTARASVPRITRVGDEVSLASLVRCLQSAGALALVPNYEGEPHSAQLKGLGIAARDAGVWYVDFEEVDQHATAAALGPLLVRPDLRVATDDAKALLHLLGSVGIELPTPHSDVELFSFLISSAARDHSLESQVRTRLHGELPERKESRGAESGVSAAVWCGSAARAVEELAPLLEAELTERELAPVARSIDLPLVPVLRKMERAGIGVDLAVFGEISKQVDAACEDLLQDVYRLAGHEFKVASPVQLAQVLFDELKLPIIRKGKTGPSTDHEVLEKLAELHALPRAIIEYRNVAKLKSTYLDTLPKLVGADGRIRTTFHQTTAATGRLSSTNPNLQNIPVRSDLGRQLRRAFVAQSGWVLVSADYSQVELRILAHIAKDEGLIRAFAEGADVHARTAAEVFGVGEQQVTVEQRRIAKMVNYGIAYGLSAHGLASRLGIPIEEAQATIHRYFARFPGIARYIEETIAHGRRTGGVESLFGRRRDLPELSSRNRNAAMAAERAAINMPIQGTATDIIKLAMIELDRRLGLEKREARLVLQVHDELVLEVPIVEVDAVKALLAAVMTGAGHLSVPLVVAVGSGQSWADAH